MRQDAPIAESDDKDPHAILFDVDPLSMQVRKTSSLGRCFMPGTNSWFFRVPLEALWDDQASPVVFVPPSQRLHLYVGAEAAFCGGVSSVLSCARS